MVLGSLASLLDLIYTLFDLDKLCIDTHQTSLFAQYQEEILAIFWIYPGTHVNQLIRTAIEAYLATVSEQKRTSLLCILLPPYVSSGIVIYAGSCWVKLYPSIGFFTS